MRLSNGQVSWRFESFGRSRLFGVRIPDWFLILVVAIGIASPWFPWTFSLRTLLIATTLIAVVLGLAALSVQ
jgi:hypothetical protein